MTLLPEVRRQLGDAARRRATGGWTRRLTGLLRGGPRRGLVVVLAAVLGTGAAAYGASRLIAGNTAPYINAALQTLARRDPACPGYPIPGSTSQGSPSPALLSILGVLRRPAAPADEFPPPGVIGLGQRHGRPHQLSRAARLSHFGVDVYVRYVRRARTAYGAAYYLIPAGGQSFETPAPARCTAELEHDLPRMPAALRTTARREIVQMLAAQRRSDQPHPSVCVTALKLTGRFAGDGGGVCGSSPSAIAGGRSLGSTTTPGGSTTFTAIVPDGVATVTISFADGATTTARVVGNVLVARAPPGTGARAPVKMVWRSAGGRILKTIARA
ncbi:MAG TPA: hypothetical protein VHW26_11810 [Solirubrobacteraceae bacterium]|nr:hypothetical protein [Solirubrobacteraceae bacterium]